MDGSYTSGLPSYEQALIDPGDDIQRLQDLGHRYLDRLASSTITRQHWDEYRGDWVLNGMSPNANGVGIGSRIFEAISRWKLQHKPQVGFRHVLLQLLEINLTWQVQTFADFHAEEPYDLSFSRGHVIQVSSVSPDGSWMRGTHIDAEGELKTGIFPARTCQYKVIALYAYPGDQRPGELAFDVGQIIDVVGLDVLFLGTWLRGSYTDSQTGKLRTGPFPRHVIAPYHPEIPMEPLSLTESELRTMRATSHDKDLEAQVADSLVRQMESLRTRLEDARIQWPVLPEGIAVRRNTSRDDGKRSPRFMIYREL